MKTEVPSTQGRPHFEFKENFFNHFRDMSNLTFENISTVNLLSLRFGSLFLGFFCIESLLNEI